MKKRLTAMTLLGASLGLMSSVSAETTPNAPYLSTSGQGQVQDKAR